MGLNLNGTHFLDCAMQEVDFSEALLHKVDFSGSDLQRTIFRNTDLREADLRKARNYSISPQITTSAGQIQPAGSHGAALCHGHPTGRMNPNALNARGKN
jgi:hypothetical protein